MLLAADAPHHSCAAGSTLRRRSTEGTLGSGRTAAVDFTKTCNFVILVARCSKTTTLESLQGQVGVTWTSNLVPMVVQVGPERAWVGQWEGSGWPERVWSTQA